MIAAASFLYFSTNSSAPEKAIWLMYLSISSAVIPIPRSEMVMVLSSNLTRTVRSPNSPLNSPTDESVFNFCVASTALETSSRRKISWSLYKNFLMIGNIFSDVTPMLPCLLLIIYFIFYFTRIDSGSLSGLPVASQQNKCQNIRKHHFVPKLARKTDRFAQRPDLYTSHGTLCSMPMKHFVSPDGTLCFTRRNTSFHSDETHPPAGRDEIITKKDVSF